MAEKEKIPSCVQPAAGPLVPAPKLASAKGEPATEKEVPEMIARVGKEAPDFETNAFVVCGPQSGRVGPPGPGIPACAGNGRSHPLRLDAGPDRPQARP